jgi:hypothetical protein
MQSVALVDQHQVESQWFLSMTAKAHTFGRGAKAWQQIEHARTLWVKRFKYKWGKDAEGALVFWKKEITNAGTPHIHAIIFWTHKCPAPSFRAFTEWNDQAWVECAQTAGFFADRKCACQTEILHKRNGVKYYVAKYVAKDCFADVRTGRMWGAFNREAMKVRLHHRVVGMETAIKVSRVLAKYREKNSARKSLRWVGPRDLPGQILHFTPASARFAWFNSPEARAFYPPWAIKDKSVGPSGDDALLYFARQSQHWKWVVKKRRAHFNYDVKLWSQDVDSGKLEPCGVERHAFASGVTMGVSAAMVDRLVEWAEREVASEVEFALRCPI